MSFNAHSGACRPLERDHVTDLPAWSLLPFERNLLVDIRIVAQSYDSAHGIAWPILLVQHKSEASPFSLVLERQFRNDVVY